LLKGDSVLGQGTTGSEDLGDYLASLQKMLDASDKYETINPGHGPVVPDGPKTICMFIDHILEREAQIVALLRTTPPDDAWTTWMITLKVYKGLPEDLNGIQLHLKKLEKEGRVKSLGGESKDEWWVLVNKQFRCIWNHLRELWRRPDLLSCVLRLAEHHIFSDCRHFLDYGCGHSLVVIVDTFAMC
jgi:Beta-lactamase associated winged helix domain